MSHCSSREAIFCLQFSKEYLLSTKAFSTVDSVAIITVKNNQNAPGDIALLFLLKIINIMVIA